MGLNCRGLVWFLGVVFMFYETLRRVLPYADL